MNINSVSRALSILSLFSPTTTHLGISEIGKLLGLKNQTVHGLVRTLVSEGFLKQNDKTKKYSLGIKTFEIGHHFLGSSQVYQVAAAPCAHLAENTGLTTRLAIRCQYSMVVLKCVFAGAEKFQYYSIGPRLPSYCCGLGKAILAWLPQDELEDYFEHTALHKYTPNTITNRTLIEKDLEKSRIRGYAIDQEELITGLVCYAAPIFDQRGNAVGALSVSSEPESFEPDRFSTAIDKLILTTTEISYSLGHYPKISPM